MHRCIEPDSLHMQEYEGAVEDRNHTGIMLIDRNDELCILYEKANTQEEVMRKGLLQLANQHMLSCVLDGSFSYSPSAFRLEATAVIIDCVLPFGRHPMMQVVMVSVPLNYFSVFYTYRPCLLNAMACSSGDPHLGRHPNDWSSW